MKCEVKSNFIIKEKKCLSSKLLLFQLPGTVNTQKMDIRQHATSNYMVKKSSS